MTLLVLAGALVGAAGFRLRGSSAFQRITGRGATSARLLCWALPLGLLSWLAVPALYAVAIACGLYLGSVPGWWRSLSLGRNPMDGPWIKAAFRHTLRGLLWGGLPAVAVAMAGGAWWWPLLAGAAVVLPYEAGWRLRPQQAVEIGELGFGALLGAAVLAGAVAA